METAGTIARAMLVGQEKKPLETSLRKWRSAEELKEVMINYAPNKQNSLCMDEEVCYFGESPTLAFLNMNYDRIAAQAWLIPQLTDLAEFSNCKGILSPGLIRSCADMIASRYYHLKLTELMLFFYNFKLGRYGKFYGNVSPMVIMSSLNDFMRERLVILNRHEEIEERRRREEGIRNSISAEEHYAPKKRVIITYFNCIVDFILSLTKK